MGGERGFGFLATPGGHCIRCEAELEEQGFLCSECLNEHEEARKNMTMRTARFMKAAMDGVEVDEVYEKDVRLTIDVSVVTSDKDTDEDRIEMAKELVENLERKYMTLADAEVRDD